jgi:N-acetylglucosaminyldiphosphoundecaprenol N-acetyl-beta-D-mannosaminyltransferase
LDSVNILGIDIHCISQEGILDSILRWNSESKKRNIYYVNAHCLNIASENKEYCDVLHHADLVYPDGASIVWGSSILGGCKIKKLSLIHWIDQLFDFIVRNNLRIYIIAGKPGLISKAVNNILEIHPKMNITGFNNGYLTKESQKKIFNEINRTSPDILFVGMGSPNQEIWINKNRERISAKTCWAVGALFDYIAGEERIVPGWVNDLGFEWLWRLYMDPKGKWKRYLIGNPVFIYRIIKQKFGMK